MPTHQKASTESRSLCEHLQEELRKLIPGLRELQSTQTCALYEPGKNRFAHVYHRRKDGLIRVYFRGDPMVLPKNSSVEVKVRPAVDEGWAKEYPLFFAIDEHAMVPAAARILFDFAYPLSVKRSRAKRNSVVSAENVSMPEEIPEDAVLMEGATKRVLVNVYERNPVARKLCIHHYGVKCVCCNFDFYSVYGERGKDFIHVHHTKRLADIKIDYRVDPINDLKPVCPNCHAMIHRTKVPARCEEIAKCFKK